MSVIPYFNILMGSFSGIAAYKKHPVDYILLGSYFSIITPIQVISVYSRLDVLSKIRLQGVNPYYHIPTTILLLTAGNLSMFGLGYIAANSAYSIYTQG